MKLLYLYIRDYGILKDIEFNFDSEHRFTFDKDTRELKKIPAENPLPDDFFSINKTGPDRVVESVSALIGNNGGGKTTVARFLHDLSQKKHLEYVLVWKGENIFDPIYNRNMEKEQIYYDYFIVPEKLEKGEFSRIIKYLSTYNSNNYKHDLNVESEACQERMRNYEKIVSKFYNIQKSEILNPDSRRQFAYQFSKPLKGYSIRTSFGDKRCDKYASIMEGMWDWQNTYWDIFAYCSNYYYSQHGISSIGITRDLSTSFLMKNDREKYLNHNLSIEYSVDRTVAHDWMDMARNLRFFNAFHDAINNCRWNLPKPLGTVISINDNDLNQLIKYINNILNKYEKIVKKHDLENNAYEMMVDIARHDNIRGAEETELQLRLKVNLRRIFNLLSIRETKNKSFLIQAICCFLGNYCRNDIEATQVPECIIDILVQVTYDFICNIESLKINTPQQSLTQINDYVNGLYKHFQGFLADLAEKYRTYEGNIIIDGKKIKQTFGSDFSHKIENTRELFTILKSSLLDSTILKKADESIFIDIKGNYGELMKFFQNYFNSNSITDYFNFSWYPPVSSGEIAQLNLYSRLYDLRQELDKKRTQLIVFMDEVEITVETLAQRELVQNLILFFETFYEGHKVHLIFASHSPVLLSDIPKSNVCFIERSEEEVGPMVEIVNPEIDNTFGANIHSLYRHSFFMKKDGTMGALATNRINDAIKILNSDNDMKKFGSLEEETKYALDVIGLIGEPVIREKLMSMYVKKYCTTTDSKIKILEEELKREKKKKELEEENKTREKKND